MNFLSSLPPEIAIQVIANLEVRDVINCQAVSRSWYDLMNQDRVWKKFWNVENPPKECRLRREYGWMLDIPCKWKLHYFNHKKVIRNWKEDKFTKHEISGRLFIYTAYDGHTLVVNDFVGLAVYRVERGSLVLVQRLKFKKFETFMCTTNTKYIAARYKSFILVYVLVNGKYKVSHMIYSEDHGTKLLCESRFKFMKNIKYNSPIFAYWSNILCILGDTLFLNVPDTKKLYAWDMKNMNCLMETSEHINDVVDDKTRLYIASDNCVLVYDESGALSLNIKCPWVVRKMHVNRNIILGIKCPYDDEKTEVCIWDKYTGQVLIRKDLSLDLGCILHPNRDIIFDVTDTWELEKKELYALDVKDDITLWKTLVGEYDLLGDIHSLVADRFLLFSTYSRHISIHDTKSGDFLYNIYGIDDDNICAYYDMLIYANKRTLKLIVQVYS